MTGVTLHRVVQPDEDIVRPERPLQPWLQDFIPSTIYHDYAGSMNICITPVIVKQRLVQIGRKYKPSEYSSKILAAIR